MGVARTSVTWEGERAKGACGRELQNHLSGRREVSVVRHDALTLPGSRKQCK